MPLSIMPAVDRTGTTTWAATAITSTWNTPAQPSTRAAPPAGRRPPPLQRHRAGRDAHDHRRQRVVATPLLEPEPDHHEHRRPGERAQRGAPPHPDAADHGQRRARRQEHDRVGHVCRRRRVGGRLRALAVREGGAGPAVVDLPADVRQQQDERDPGGNPWAARPQHTPLRRQREPRHQRQQQRRDRVLGLEADAGHHAHRRPQPRHRPGDRDQHQVERRGLGRQIEPRGMEEAGCTQRDRRRRPGQRRQRLRPQATAQLARAQGHEGHAGQPDHHRRHAQRVQRRPEHDHHRPPDHGDQRREVDVSEREMMRRLQEVELVAVPSVAAQEGQPDQGRHQRRQHRYRQRRAHGRARPGGLGRLGGSDRGRGHERGGDYRRAQSAGGAWVAHYAAASVQQRRRHRWLVTRSST